MDMNAIAAVAALLLLVSSLALKRRRDAARAEADEQK